VEVLAWPSRFAVPDLKLMLLFEMEMDGDGKSGAGGRAGAGAGVGGGRRRADAQGPGHVAGARRRLEPDGLRRMTTRTTIKSLGFDSPLCLLDHSLSDFSSSSPFFWMKIL